MNPQTKSPEHSHYLGNFMKKDHQLMQEAAREIRQLRDTNQSQGQQLDIIRLFQIILLPKGEQWMAVDIVSLLEKRVAEIQGAEKSENKQSDGL